MNTILWPRPGPKGPPIERVGEISTEIQARVAKLGEAHGWTASPATESHR